LCVLITQLAESFKIELCFVDVGHHPIIKRESTFDIISGRLSKVLFIIGIKEIN